VGFDPRATSSIIASGLSGRYWFARWTGPDRPAAGGVCLYYMLPSARGPGADCFDLQSYLRGQALSYWPQSGGVELVGLVPPGAGRVEIDPATGSRLVAQPVRGAYAVRLARVPERVVVEIAGRRTQLRLREPSLGLKGAGSKTLR
jgi:hypothetical protein